MPPKASDPPEGTSFVRNTLCLSPGCVCVSRGSSCSPHLRSGDKGTGMDGMHFLSIPWRAAPLSSGGRKRGCWHPGGVAGEPLSHLILPSQPRCPVNGAGYGPAAPSPAAAAHQPPPPPRLLLGVKKDIEKQGGEL